MCDEAFRVGGGASPKIKNLIKAPIRRTTESWPTRRPWVKVNPEDIVMLKMCS